MHRTRNESLLQARQHDFAPGTGKIGEGVIPLPAFPPAGVNKGDAGVFVGQGVEADGNGRYHTPPPTPACHQNHQPAASTLLIPGL